jgi:hypothetical protein
VAGAGRDSAPRPVSNDSQSPAAGSDSIVASQAPVPLDTAELVGEHVAGDTTDGGTADHDMGGPRLSPLADSIGHLMVFMVKERQWFLAASRSRHLLVDLGRVDATVKTAAERKAFLEAMTALSPVKVGDRFSLRGPWGADDATVGSFQVWNGRITARLIVPPKVDSLVRGPRTLVAGATIADTMQLPIADSAKVAAGDSAKVSAGDRAKVPSGEAAKVSAGDRAKVSAGDSTKVPAADTCTRDSVPTQLMDRANAVRDSVTQLLEADTLKLIERFKRTMRSQSSTIVGCFGTARLLLVVDVYAGDYEYVKEVALLFATDGTATPVRLSDLRFKAHELLEVLDLDGDGVDDIATRGRAERIGGTSLLRLNPAKHRFEYVTSGFSWETM